MTSLAHPQLPEWPVQKYARLTGILLLTTIVAGFFGEFYIPNKLVATDAATTAQNITGSMFLFRLSFAAYLVEAVCDIALTWLFYVLLRPVRPNLALLAAFFGLVSTATFATGELFYFSSSFILGGGEFLKGFSPDQINGLATLSLKYYGLGAGVFMVFYGIASVIRGYLIVKSDFLPRALGALVMLAGLGFIVRSFLVVLAPGYASDFLLLPMFVAMLSLAAWFVFKGIDTAQWEAKARSGGG